MSCLAASYSLRNRLDGVTLPQRISERCGRPGQSQQGALRGRATLRIEVLPERLEDRSRRVDQCGAGNGNHSNRTRSRRA